MFCYCCFGADWAVRAVLKISAILLKYPTRVIFSGQNKYRIRVSVHSSVCSKKLVDIKVRKLSILAAKCTFWGQKSLLSMPEYIDSVYIVLGSYSITLAVIWQKKNPAIKVLNYGVGVSWLARTQALALNKIGLGLRNSYIQ